MKCLPAKVLDTMEGAVRLFAGEFSRSTLTVPGEDWKSTAWVVTPSGAWCRQVFLAGALVEVHEDGDMLSFRIADPTGGFDLVCGGRFTPLAESVKSIPLPSFVSVLGRAQFYRKEGIPVLTIRPDHVQVIDRAVRDQWVVTTAVATLARLAQMHRTMDGDCTDERIVLAYSHYAPTKEDLGGLAAMIADALKSTRPKEDAPLVQADPRELIMDYIRTAGGPQGVAVKEVIEMARQKAVSRDVVLAVIESLIVEDECYQPRKGYIKPL